MQVGMGLQVHVLAKPSTPATTAIRSHAGMFFGIADTGVIHESSARVFIMAWGVHVSICRLQDPDNSDSKCVYGGCKTAPPCSYPKPPQGQPRLLPIGPQKTTRT